MVLRAILFDLSGVIINDEAIHQGLLDDLLLEENIVSASRDYNKYCLGRGDRSLKDLLFSRGRIVTEEALDRLILRKSKAYLQYVQQEEEEEEEDSEKLTIYPGLYDFLEELKKRNLHIGLVAGNLCSEAIFILEKLELLEYFEVIVGADDFREPKPSPQSYLVALEKFNQCMKLSSDECLVIEDTPVGIKAAKQAGMQVVGIANTYPFHFMQRLSNWAVDYLQELELDRIEEMFKEKIS